MRFNDHVLDKNGSITVSRGTDHGYGIETIRTIVKKYSGVLTLDEEEYFTVGIAFQNMHS